MTSSTPPPPPGPGQPPVPPPPPGPAQRLAARAGATVYEGGSSIFDEPVLIYLSTSPRSTLEFQICNHVDRPLGYCTATGEWTFRPPTVEVCDPLGAPLLQIRPKTDLFRFTRQVEGVASAVFTLPPFSSKELTITKNNEPFGFVVGSGGQSITGPRLSILDHDRHEVGTVTVFRPNFLFQWRKRQPSTGHVLSLRPGLRGPLRQLVLAVPPVVEAFRLQQQSS